MSCMLMGVNCIACEGFTENLTPVLLQTVAVLRLYLLQQPAVHVYGWVIIDRSMSSCSLLSFASVAPNVAATLPSVKKGDQLLSCPLFVCRAYPTSSGQLQSFTCSLPQPGCTTGCMPLDNAC